MIAQLTDSMLDVEFSEEDVEMLGYHAHGLPRAVRVPGSLEDAFYARAIDMHALPCDDSRTFALDDDMRLEIAEAICALWVGTGIECDVYFYGAERELWCQAEHGFAVEVVAPRSSSALWTLLTFMVVLAEVALAVVLAAFEGVSGALLIILLITPLVVICLVATLRSWRCRVTATLHGLDVRPTVGASYHVSLNEILLVERWEGSAFEPVRKLVIHAPSHRVTVRRAQAGIEELNAFLVSYLDSGIIKQR